MKKSIIWQLAIVAILFSTPSYAEPSALTLDQVIKESLQKNTSLFRAQRDFEDRMADVTETTLLDNPELQIDAVRDKGEGGTGTDLEFTQSLKFSQISGARGGYAQALANVASMEQKYEILQVINETTVQARHTALYIFAIVCSHATVFCFILIINSTVCTL